MRLSHRHARIGRVAGGGKAVNIGFRDEPPVDQLHRALEIRLGELGIGLGDRDVRLAADCLLVLHRTVDHGEDLAGLDPLPCIDRNRNHPAAFADHADWHFAPRGERTGGGDRAFDRRPAGNHHGDRGYLVLIFGRELGLAAASSEEQHDRQHHDERAADQQPALAAAPALVLDLRQRIALGKGATSAGVNGRLVVHYRQESRNPATLAGVLYQ